MSKYVPPVSSVAYNSHFQRKSDLTFSEDSADIKSLIMANGIYDRFEMGINSRFARISPIDPYNALLTTKEYIFITKPDLCIFNTTTGVLNSDLARYPFFVDAINRYKNVALQLQSSMAPGSIPFIPMLSNTITSSTDLPGISAETIETGSNIMGTKISYRGTSWKSDEDFDFNLEFEDTKYLDVYMLFKIYDEYEKLKWNGALEFSEESCGSNRWQNYIINKVLHDQVSIYKFVVGDDGQRLVYWARLTGCYPTSIPREAFSDMNNSDPQKITVGWKSHFVRDMDPIILNQFNSLIRLYKPQGGTVLPLFNNTCR